MSDTPREDKIRIGHPKSELELMKETSRVIRIELSLRVRVRQKRGVYSASCDELDIHSQGGGKMEVLKNIEEAIQLFFVTCIEQRIKNVAPLRDKLGHTVTGTLAEVRRSANSLAGTPHQDTVPTIDSSQQFVGVSKGSHEVKGLHGQNHFPPTNSPSRGELADAAPICPSCGMRVCVCSIAAYEANGDR